MMPKNGQYVKCMLRNNTIVEGVVQNWAGGIVSGITQLLSVDGESILIIPNSEDIMLIKIMLDKSQVQIEEIKEKIITESELEQQFQEKYEEHHDPHDEARNKSLAELKVLLAKQEYKIVSEKLRTHHPGSAYNLSTAKYPKQLDVLKNSDPTRRSAYMPGSLKGKI